MAPERHCLYCNAVIGLNWARGNRKYCDESCRSSFHYYNKYQKSASDRYQRLKKQWEKSDNGKKAGIAIREWLKLPKDWR